MRYALRIEPIVLGHALSLLYLISLRQFDDVWIKKTCFNLIAPTDIYFLPIGLLFRARSYTDWFHMHFGLLFIFFHAGLQHLFKLIFFNVFILFSGLFSCKNQISWFLSRSLRFVQLLHTFPLPGLRFLRSRKSSCLLLRKNRGAFLRYRFESSTWDAKITLI